MVMRTPMRGPTARRSRGPYRGRFVPGTSIVGRFFRPIRYYAPSLRSQLYEMRYQGRRFIAILSIVLGDGQVLEEGVTGNKRLEGTGVRSGTDHDTMQLHGAELAYPKTALWLPENLKNRAATLGYKDGEDFLNNMRMIFREVLKFGARATHVAHAFARMEFDRVQHVLFNVQDLRVALQALVEGMETKLPLLDPLLPNIVDSIGFVPSASYILEPRPPIVGSEAGDIPSQLRAQFYDSEQFYIFVSILLGEDHPPDEDATVHDTAVWLPEYLKKRDAILGSSVSHCWDSYLKFTQSAESKFPDYATPAVAGDDCQGGDKIIGLHSPQLIMPFREMMKHGARTTAVAKAFAGLKIEHAEYWLDRPEDLRSVLQELDANAEDNVFREQIKILTPELEIDPTIPIPFGALPETLLPDVEPIDDDYIKLSVYRYFGQM